MIIIRMINYASHVLRWAYAHVVSQAPSISFVRFISSPDVFCGCNRLLNRFIVPKRSERKLSIFLFFLFLIRIVLVVTYCTVAVVHHTDRHDTHTDKHELQVEHKWEGNRKRSMKCLKVCRLSIKLGAAVKRGKEKSLQMCSIFAFYSILPKW